ncbi:MAG: hypothetical protein D6816_16505 [Bacteroidetes bacterium]|nr:MAG: hypothetical protein D6816_16505 [Bacteroidota bacterium]
MNNPQSQEKVAMTQDNPLFHLPLDEIRHNPEKGHSYTANIGRVQVPAVVYGNPQVVHTPEMGTCMIFNGKDEYVELAGLEGFALSGGFSMAAWLRIDDALGARPIHVFTLGARIENKELYIGRLTYRATTQTLKFALLDKIIHISGIAAGQWIHFAASFDEKGAFQIYVHDMNGALLPWEGTIAKGIKMAEMLAVQCNLGFIGKSLRPDAQFLDSKLLGSIKIPKGLQVTLYENEDFTGPLAPLTADAQLLAPALRDSISAIAIDYAPDMVATIYEDVGYQGASQALPPGRYLAKDLTIGADLPGSIKVPDGLKVTIEEAQRPLGSITGDVSFIGANTIVVERASQEKVTFFSNADFQGERFEADDGGRYQVGGLLAGAVSHFRLYDRALSEKELYAAMLKDKNSMAHMRETAPVKIELYTIRDDDHKPILYVEAANKGEPLEVSITNPHDKPVTFKQITAPTEQDFHVQLRFRRNVIAPNVFKRLQAAPNKELNGWQYAIGTSPDGREDYISFVKKEGAFTLNRGELTAIQIPDFSAAAQGGARNTRIEVRFRTDIQDPGSVIRHMEVQSHLGLKTIPLVAMIKGSNTILNDGKAQNELTIEIRYTKPQGGVTLVKQTPLTASSSFELIVSEELMVDEAFNISTTVEGLNGQPPESGEGHKSFVFDLQKDGLTVDKANPLTFKIDNWITSAPTGTHNILLRYENIPGYWDGMWVLPVQFGPLVMRDDKVGIGTDEPAATLHVKGDAIFDKVGIGTDEPGADLEIRRDVTRGLGPVLRLNNFGKFKGAGAAIDFNGYDVGDNDPTFRIQSVDDDSCRSELVFRGKATASVEGKLEDKARITAEGRIKDRTGFLMPVGAIIAYGGENQPEGWLLCDGQWINYEDEPWKTLYKELYEALGSPPLKDYREKKADGTYGPWKKGFQVPDLRSRFIVGAGQREKDEEEKELSNYDLNAKGGAEKVTLTEKQMPKHTHTDKDKPDTKVTTSASGSHDHSTTSTRKFHDGGTFYAITSTGDSDSKSAKSEDHHDVQVEMDGSHVHTISIPSAGGDQPHENRPPYYALTYIIKY